LNDILQSHLWFEEINELFFQNKEYEGMCTHLESLEIKEMEEDLIKHQASEAVKFNHKDFFKGNNKRLSNLLECIVKAKHSNETPIKINVLERLISKGKELNFRENQTEMVFLKKKLFFEIFFFLYNKITTFQEFLNKCKNIYDWIRKFNQLINFEKKKKIKKNNIKKEPENENKDNSLNMLSNLKSSIFGFLKEEKADLSLEKDYAEEKNKMELEKSPVHNNELDNEKNESVDNEEFNILNLKENSKGKKSPTGKFYIKT